MKCMKSFGEEWEIRGQIIVGSKRWHTYFYELSSLKIEVSFLQQVLSNLVSTLFLSQVSLSGMRHTVE